MSLATNMPRLPILTTKLAIPPYRSDSVTRRRLTERLEAGLSGKLTLLSAPPGSGKTTLVTEWLATSGRDRNVAWLGLDAGDNDPGRFLTYFVAAIRTVQPDFGPRLINLLQTAVSQDGSVALVDLINALSALPEPVVLVLDDYHVIDNEGVHRALSYILDHQPPSFHIIMTSREMPPLPLSLLRTRREVVEFRREDLRFTVDEATIFLNEVMGLSLDCDHVLALEQRTEGWIAGLLLAALSARESPDAGAVLDGFDGEHRYVFDYLAEEVFGQQTEEVQQFLEQTSVLGRMSAPLVESLTGAGQEMLDYLVDANLFTLPLDNQRNWYRYHHIFSDFLSARFRQRDPEGWQAAHRRAGQWFYDNNHRFEAAEHALAGGDHQRLAELIAEIGQLLVRRGRISTIQRWLAAIPDEIVRQQPALLIQYAWATMFSRDLEQARYWLDQIDLDAIPDDDQQLALRIELEVCRATYFRFEGNSEETIRLSRSALELSERRQGRHDPNVSVAMLHLGSTLRIKGDTRNAIEYLQGALELSRQGVERIVELNSMSQLSAAYWDLGRFDEAERQSREALELESEYGLNRVALAGAARTMLADVLRQRGELDEARYYAQQAFEIFVASRDGEDIVAQVLALYTTALIELASGSADEARAAIDEAMERASRYIADDGRRRAAYGLRAHIHLLLGDPEQAARWDPSEFLAAPPAHPYLDERATLAAAWLLAEQGRKDEAAEALDRLLHLCERSGRLAQQSDARLLFAAVREDEGRHEEALELAIPAAEWALENRAWRSLVDTHPATRSLLPDIRRYWTDKGHPWPEYLKAWTSAPVAVRPVQAGLAEPLTDRELEVLALLYEGMQNRAIAERLFISLGTVKRHTHNIYGKLGVHNRTQAIIRGQELGLFEVS